MLIKALNHSKSKNVKLFVTNIDPEHMVLHGAVDFRLIYKRPDRFHGPPTTRTFYFYVRERFLRYDRRLRRDNKCKINIQENQYEYKINRDIQDIDPMLQEPFQIYQNGRHNTFHGINCAIVNHNLA